MSYRFDQKGSLGEQVARIAREQLQRAITEAGANTDVGERIHSIRTCIKKSRSLLRLIRPAVPEAFYQSQTARLRRAGRLLAPMRDADVQWAVFEQLKVPRANMAGQRVRAVLEEHRNKTSSNSTKPLEKIKPLLVQSLTSAKHWPLADYNIDTAIRGMEARYRSARKAFKQARRKEDAKTLHCWRGKAKTYWHALRLFEDAPSKALKSQARWAKKLGDLLGKYHDLTVLRDTIAKTTFSVKGRKRINRDLARRCAALKKRSLALGARTFQTKPGALVKKLEPGLKKHFK